jgi:hypothetical protein
MRASLLRSASAALVIRQLLLDPQGRILSWGDLRKNQLPIDGKGLMSTPEQLLSKPQ